MKLASKLNIAQKLGILVMALVLPLAYVSAHYAVSLWSKIDEHASADDGLHYFDGLKDAGRALAAHASFTATVLGGEANTSYFDRKIREAAAAIDESIKVQDQSELKYGREGSKERALWREIKADWASLGKSWPKLEPEAARDDTPPAFT